MAIVQGILLVIYTAVSIAFIALVATQTSKNEGLTGSIGVPMPSNFKGKAGYEERIRGYTMYLGVGWFFASILLGVLFRAG